MLMLVSLQLRLTLTWSWSSSERLTRYRLTLGTQPYYSLMKGNSTISPPSVVPAVASAALASFKSFRCNFARNDDDRQAF